MAQVNPTATDGWIEIFRAGDFTAKGKGVVTREDLQAIAKAYDPTFHEAPVVVGHPADNLPAYGWIGQLRVEQDVLQAQEKQVDPAFHQLRQAGRYKKRSASFYTDADGKAVYLRHVGWLGAQPPEVKGLRDVKFSDEGKKFIEFEEDTVAAEKTFAEQFKETFAQLLGLNGSGAPRTFGEDDVKRVATEAAAAASAPLLVKVTELETKLAKQTTDFAERERKLAGGEVEQRAATAVAKLKVGGKWVPAFEKMGLPLLFAELAKIGGTVEFGEGAEKKTVSPLDLFVDFMEKLPKIVPEGARFDGTAAARATSVGTVDYGEKADPNSVQLDALVKKHMADHKVNYGEALTAVAAAHPALTKPGNGSAGAV
jgi:hypothetical protein